METEPKTELLGIIMKRLHKEERIFAIKRVILFSIIMVCSVAGVVPAFNILVLDVSKSGFYNFVSLAFSDFSVVITYWQSFIMVLLETLPALSLALVLAVILTFLQSTRLLVKDIKKLNIIRHGF